MTTTSIAPEAAMVLPVTLSRRILLAMRRAKVGVRDLAAAIGASESTARRRLADSHTFSLGELWEASKALNVKMSTLFRYDPQAHAEALGIEVRVQHLEPEHGLWLPDSNLILVSDRVRPWGIEGVLAHEVAHAVLGHRESNPRNEFEANRLALRWLTTASDAMTVVEPDGVISWRKLTQAGFTSRMLRDYITPLAAEIDETR